MNVVERNLVYNSLERIFREWLTENSPVTSSEVAAALIDARDIFKIQLGKGVKELYVESDEAYEPKSVKAYIAEIAMLMSFVRDAVEGRAERFVAFDRKALSLMARCCILLSALVEDEGEPSPDPDGDGDGYDSEPDGDVEGGDDVNDDDAENDTTDEGAAGDDTGGDANDDGETGDDGGDTGGSGDAAGGSDSGDGGDGGDESPETGDAPNWGFEG